MKKTFSIRILDWILIAISLLFSVRSVWDLTKEFAFLSGYLIRIVFALVSIMAVFALLLPKINGERFSRIFIVVLLLIPSILIAYQFIIDLVLYGAVRTDLLQNPLLYLNLIVGVILFYLTLKYSKQEVQQQRKDYGILIIGTGVFAICYVLSRTLEPILYTDLNHYPLWKTIVKSLIGIVTIAIGTQIKNLNYFKKQDPCK